MYASGVSPSVLGLGISIEGLELDGRGEDGGE